MAGIKQPAVAALLKSWLKRSCITQAQLAEKEQVSQVVISRQLSGYESIPFDRIKRIIELTKPSKDELALIDRYLPNTSGEEYKQNINELHHLVDVIGGNDPDLADLLFFWPDIPKKIRQLHIKPIIDWCMQEYQRALEEGQELAKKSRNFSQVLTSEKGNLTLVVPIRDNRG